MSDKSGIEWTDATSGCGLLQQIHHGRINGQRMRDQIPSVEGHAIDPGQRIGVLLAAVARRTSGNHVAVDRLSAHGDRDHVVQALDMASREELKALFEEVSGHRMAAAPTVDADGNPTVLGDLIMNQARKLRDAS